MKRLRKTKAKNVAATGLPVKNDPAQKLPEGSSSKQSTEVKRETRQQPANIGDQVALKRWRRYVKKVMAMPV